MVAVYSDGFKKVAKDTYPIMSTTGLVPTRPPAAGSSGHAPHIPLFDQRASEELALDDGTPPPEVRYALVQCTEAGESVLVCATCLDYLEEDGVRLGWQESMEFVEKLLADAAKPPNLYAHEWRPGTMIIWDNRTLQHSVTPYWEHNGRPMHHQRGARRVLAHTRLVSSWQPSPLPQNVAPSNVAPHDS